MMQETPTEIRLIAPNSKQGAEVVEEILGSKEENDIETALNPSSSLVCQLSDFLASNLNAISFEDKLLRLFIDPTGRGGIDFPTGVRPINILAVDNEGSLFVFELKWSASSDKAIGQLARYIGWVQQTVGKGQKLFGIIVAQVVNKNPRYAVSIIPNVCLFEDKVSFHLTPAHNFKPD